MVVYLAASLAGPVGGWLLISQKTQPFGRKNMRITHVAAAAIFCALGFGGAANAAEVRLMTGPQAGFWVPLGGQLKDAWEKAVPDLKIQSLPGAGIANIRAIQEGKAEIGFGNTITTADAVAGTGEAPLDKKHDKICNVATLYPQYFQMVANADAGVNTLKEVKGKGFATQVKGNTGELIARHVLRVTGYTYNDVKAVASQVDDLGKAPISTSAIRTQLDLAQGQWVFFDAALQRQTDNRGLEAVATTSERLLEVMNRLTDLYEAALKDVLG